VPNSRDFVPWRFSDAGRRAVWLARSCRRPKTCTQPDVGRCSKIGRRNVQHRSQHAAEMLDYSPAVRDARRRVRSFAFGRAATTRFDKEIIIKSQQTFLGKPEEQLVF
jgi:hypothetical protein